MDESRVLGERFEHLVKDLDQKECEKLLKEILDDFACAFYGVSCLSETLDTMKKDLLTQSIVVQTLNNGKAVLISPKGYTVRETIQVKDNQTIFVLFENETFLDIQDEI